MYKERYIWWGWNDCGPVPTYAGMDHVTSLPSDPKPPDPKLLQLYHLAKLRKDKVQMSYLEKRIRC